MPLFIRRWIGTAPYLVQACMSEYDLNGWTAAALSNPDDVSWLPQR
jgi:hypothetical protein